MKLTVTQDTAIRIAGKPSIDFIKTGAHRSEVHGATLTRNTDEPPTYTLEGTKLQIQTIEREAKIALLPETDSGRPLTSDQIDDVWDAVSEAIMTRGRTFGEDPHLGVSFTLQISEQDVKSALARLRI